MLDKLKTKADVEKQKQRRRQFESLVSEEVNFELPEEPTPKAGSFTNVLRSGSKQLSSRGTVPLRSILSGGTKQSSVNQNRLLELEIVNQSDSEGLRSGDESFFGKDPQSKATKSARFKDQTNEYESLTIDGNKQEDIKSR